MTSHGPHPHHMTIRLLLLINSRHLHISFSAVYGIVTRAIIALVAIAIDFPLYES